MSEVFDHEKLNVCRRALDFVEFADRVVSALPKRLAVRDQLDPASTSSVLNSSDGNGEFTSKDRCRFLDITPRSALECASALDVLAGKNQLDVAVGTEGEEILRGTVSMLVGLIRGQKTDRVFEKTGEYGSED